MLNKDLSELTPNKSIFSNDLVCFSHLRWGFVYQRPQHLLSRFAKHCRVFFVEEPLFQDSEEKLHINEEKNVWVITPYLKKGHTETEIIEKQRQMLSSLFEVMNITDYFFWYLTPMALPFSKQFTPHFVVYDCMDELSAFKYAPPALMDLEKMLFNKADIVFTGGYSIYEAKKNAHPNVHPFPSSIDKEHFKKARRITSDPADQAHIPHPRFGFFGVVDERFDIELLRNVAAAKPEWHFVIIGPVIKIDESVLPKTSNIHYIGSKKYEELPNYIAGWDIAIIPFAINDSTKYISPTKTPEYLAAGRPVISTPIRDVVKPYATHELVYIANSIEEFIMHAEKELAKTNKLNWLEKTDEFLKDQSWDNTWTKMVQQIEKTLSNKIFENIKKQKAYV